MLYIANITIIVLIVSKKFIIIDDYSGFILESDASKKNQNNILDSLFCIPSVGSEHEEDLKVKLINESRIGLLLEFDQYSND